MSQKNDETTGVAMIIGVVVAGMMFLALAVFAVAAFIAFVFTILSFCAWSNPLKLGKGFTLEPEEARAFVYRGVIGAPLLLAFCAFVEILFDVVIGTQYVPHILIAGYTMGSLGVEILFAQNQTENFADIISPSQRIAPPPKAVVPAPRKEPFRFASWDDEEERG